VLIDRNGKVDQFGWKPLAMENKNRLVVYDCDIGTDDAWGLAMMLRAEGVVLPGGRSTKVVAITTVQGNTDVDNGTLNALRVLHTLNRRDVRSHQENLLKPF